MKQLFGWIGGQFILGIINLSFAIGEFFDVKDECLICGKPVKYGYPYCHCCAEGYRRRH